MNDGKTIHVTKEVESLVKKADGAATAIEALQYSQAACNAANAMACLSSGATEQPYQERVVTEKAELDDKRSKLTSFIGGEMFRTVNPVERSRLNRQLEAMTLYSDILAERILNFT